MNSCIFLFITAIEAEKGQQKFISGIENFDTSKLNHIVTEEKNPLPTKEGILCYKYTFVIFQMSLFVVRRKLDFLVSKKIERKWH